ncbi:Xylosidase/arabinosidase [Tsuneonella dongtanensis]|uniref:Xylosidase/arabinosidase n=1 Tax=Tsuneonella dongtanensis TaxID=692370 RepID=A0A1B2ABB3_9SPHN|nr:family 43 glycosylhydrolase [Tsuneonella dongtanensis]ANY19335.1 Xylosidase/arabinosidase [Tsuneonella dongtanensis]
MRYGFLAAMLMGATTASAQPQQADKANVNREPYPLGNPVVTHMYTADAAPHVMPDGKVWMVTSVDSEAGGGYSTMAAYHAFSSSDMRHWTDNGAVLTVDQVRPADTSGRRYALWAPDIIYRNGRYYLYYPVWSGFPGSSPEERKVESWIGVAVADSPAGPFRVAVPRLEGTRGIDPAVFVDDDGTAYLFWGSRMAARLSDDMLSLADEPRKIDVGTDRFMEASWLHKRDGRYYFSHHSTYDHFRKIDAANALDPERRQSELWWSVGDSPLGPFRHGGVLNYEPGAGVAGGPRSSDGDYPPWRLTLSNHGGIVEFHGQDYLFYHTSALSSWRQDRFQGAGTWTQRSVAIDRIDYDTDGAPLPVVQTVESVPAVEVNQPSERVLDRRCRTVRGSRTVALGPVDLGSGYYYFDTKVLWRGSAFRLGLRADRPDGPLIGTPTVRWQDRASGKSIAETFLRGASGTRALFVEIEQPASARMTLCRPRVFAGSPRSGAHD